MLSRSLSDLGIVGCNLAAAVHFSPAFCPIATAMGLQTRQKLSSLGPNFASTPQARQAPSALTHPAEKNVLDPSAQAWLARFAADADAALNDLLLGKAWLGGYAAAELPQALPQFFPAGLEDALDEALQRWLAAQWRRDELPDGVTAKQFAQALADTFAILQTIALPRTLRWCRELAPSLWAWLQTQPSFASREPRSALLRALALQQPDRGLLHFWMSLCRRGQKAWAQLALFGLRRMPRDDNGTPESSLPLGLVNGLLDYGLTLARGKDDVAKKKQWLGELDFLSAVYPMSHERWAGRLREALAVRSKSDALTTLRHWADERHPSANQPAPAPVGRRPLAPPHWDNDIRPVLERYDHEAAMCRPALQALMAKHLHYAREAGDNHFLVRSNCRLAEFLLQPARREAASPADESPRDASWALELGQVASAWAPSNHQTWSVVARALDALGDWSRARTVFWYARRRFPYDPFAHTQLGHALAMRGQVDEGAAVYRAAMRRFPDNPVVWADLGHTLRVAGRRDESLATYREAQQRFHRDPAIANALAGVLIDLGHTEDARAALDWADQVCPADGKNQRVLAGLRSRWQALAAGRPMQMKSLRARPDAATGDWSTLETAAGITLRGLDALGLATLWRQGAPADAAGITTSLQHAEQALEAAAEPLHRDARWQAERGLLLGANAGAEAAQAFFDRLVAQRPGDGVLAVLQRRSHARNGESVEWQSMRARFDELAPVLRIATDPSATMPADLQASLAAVTPAGGEPKLDDLDDDQRQALRIYETAGDTELSDLVQQDFLAARQLTVF